MGKIVVSTWFISAALVILIAIVLIFFLDFSLRSFKFFATMIMSGGCWIILVNGLSDVIAISQKEKRAKS